MTNDHFTDIIGQQQAVDLLSQAVAKNRIAPAYLFAGPEGVGRGLTARCFAKLLLTQSVGWVEERNPTLNRTGRREDGGNERAGKEGRKLNNHPDFLWVEPTYLHQGNLLNAAEAEAAGIKRKAPPAIRLEQVREISRFLARPPLEAGRSVVVVAQAETMAEGAANALLKTLEEPGRATIILIAPSPEALLPTLVSRCQRIPFQRLNGEDMARVLANMGKGDILQDQAVVEMAQGCPGVAVVAASQLAEIPPELLQRLQNMPANLKEALELGREIDGAIDTETQLWLINYLQHRYWHQQQTQKTRRAISLLEDTRRHLLAYVQPRLVWEVTLMQIYQAN
ncbi:DNA polymerase III subunit delta' [[Phormidium] sp. ETS-05]|uniref:DNA polymerase III subunit delta' n=1 Tax=[Phormidium] sp. ETS-05 TaxID=222819 RepID=UPI001E520113|nr:DNA polymerase III subunit delta' [[Phormidium] sp. ETS-05]